MHYILLFYLPQQTNITCKCSMNTAVKIYIVFQFVDVIAQMATHPVFEQA